MKKRVVILTGSELRHDFVRMAIGLNEAIDVVASYCEGRELSLRSRTETAGQSAPAELRLRHVMLRERAEQDFFAAFVRHAPDRSNPVSVQKGSINDPRHVSAIADLAPDIVVAYGCSLIKGDLLSLFKGRLLNVHLGLSPYWRGSGTNFWPLTEGCPEYVGATFMHMDEGVDTGAIIHQIRARVFVGDDVHRIGNRLIADMVPVYCAIIERFDKLGPMPQPEVPADARQAFRKDFDEDSVARLNSAFANNLVDTYLAELDERRRGVPILRHPALADLDPGGIWA